VEGHPEEIVFDKAEQAETLEARRRTLQQTHEQIDALRVQRKAAADASERDRLERNIAALQQREEALRAEVEAMTERLNGRGKGGAS
jgi:predicted  nucleic acid-binding Zn-ribbon protein